jgi:hypothetical protein
MQLVTEPYLTQVSRFPKNGRHIIAQYDDHSIVVYQAYSPEIGNFAATHNYFGGEFKRDRKFVCSVTSGKNYYALP